jgi:hypothetical protein
MSRQDRRLTFLAASALLLTLVSIGCSKNIVQPFVPVNASAAIAGNCTTNPDTVTINLEGQVTWTPSSSGATIYFPPSPPAQNKPPFNTNPITINGATATQSGKPNTDANACVASSATKSCTYKYTVSIASAGCSIDPRVIITK